MSALAVEAPWAAMMRAELADVDKAYRKYPLGQLVGRYMRAIQYEGKAENTRISYEPVLRLFVLFFSDYSDLEPFARAGGRDLLYQFLGHHWGETSQATRRQRASILKSFFAWAEDSGYISRDPTTRMKVPAPPPAIRNAHSLEEIRLIASCGNVRDEIAVLLMGRLAFRKSDVRMLQARDVDLAHDYVAIHRGKGGKSKLMPVEYEDVRTALSLWIPSEPREHLLHPRHNRLLPLEASTMQRWWRGLLEKAGIDPFPMHELRHSAIDHLWRQSGNLELVRQLARHESVRTTQDYLHPNEEDLRAAMREAGKE